MMQAIQLFHKKWAFYIVLFMIFGCAAPQTVEREACSVPVRDALYSNETPSDCFGAYGYVIFTGRPDEYNMTDEKYIRYLAVLKAYRGKLEPVDHDADSQQQMPTYWLLEKKTWLDKGNPTKTWIEFYDYSRAKYLASSISALSRKGPILVAWTKPFENVSDNDEALVLDLSGFPNDKIDEGFGVWMDRISRNPETWENGFDLVKIKWACHSFLECYGEKIIEAVKTVKEIIG